MIAIIAFASGELLLHFASHADRPHPACQQLRSTYAGQEGVCEGHCPVQSLGCPEGAARAQVRGYMETAAGEKLTAPLLVGKWDEGMAAELADGSLRPLWRKAPPPPDPTRCGAPTLLAQHALARCPAEQACHDVARSGPPCLTVRYGLERTRGRGMPGSWCA